MLTHIAILRGVGHIGPGAEEDIFWNTDIKRSK
jgi:hypothetical protein